MRNGKWILSMMLAALMCCAMISCAMAVEPLEITSTVDHGNGKVTIEWNNPNGGNVTVGSLVNGSQEAGNRINIKQDISGNSYTFEDLAPGLDYILLVMPELDINNAGLDVVTVKIPPEFDAFGLSLKESYLMYAQFKEGGGYSYNYAADLSTSKMLDLLDERAFLVRLDFRHPVFRNSRTLPILTVVTSPTGYVMTHYGELKIPKDHAGFWQTTMLMNDHLMTMYEDHGSIPTGKYRVQVYVDGASLGETSFTID